MVENIDTVGQEESPVIQRKESLVSDKMFSMQHAQKYKYILCVLNSQHFIILYAGTGWMAVIRFLSLETNVEV